jgi:hypothetical protein
MMKAGFKLTTLAVALSILTTGCLKGSNNSQNAGPPVYFLAVASVNPINTAIASVSPVDNEGVSSGTTNLSLIYNPGTSVTVTAESSSNSGPFISWSGCDSTSGLKCTVTMSSDKTVTAYYTGVTGVTINPTTSTVTVPGTVQFTAVVNGVGTCTYNGANTPCQNSPVVYSLVGPTGYTGALGTISATGLYTTTYPAPPSVIVGAASAVNQSAIIGATVTITTPVVSAGPALSVDMGNPTHAISPNIYGINYYGMDPSIAKAANLPMVRWGGDLTTRYNYLVDADNSAGDSYFENSFPSTTGYPQVSQFNSQVLQDELTNTKTLVTVPLIGYTTKRISACSFSVAKYGQQTVVDPNRTDCGTGLLGPLGGTSTGRVVNDPTDTSTPIDQTFVGGWAQFLTGMFGTAANGGVAIYALDNEPEYWNSVHVDVHPNPATYDELSQKGIAYAAAIKAADPTAEVSGPVISNWYAFFYSPLDIQDGDNYTPSCPQANPLDRLAHGNIPFIEYYLQQFQNYQTANGTRLLDYVDLHTDFAAPGAAFALAGNTTLEQARLNSTRVFWDPTYTDPDYTDPTNTTCNGQPYPPNLINLMKGWVSKDYPGTKLAITKYNWGGQESINGALAQADILGIFGREGLDLAMLWDTPTPTTSNGVTTQLPGIVAFQVYTNYDGKDSHFGETAVASTSANQGLLSVYGATRASDNTVTVVVINKGYGDLTSTLSLPNLNAAGSAQAYLYSAGNIASIVPQAAVTVTPASGSTPASTSMTFPAQSITLLVIPHN